MPCCQDLCRANYDFLSRLALQAHENGLHNSITESALEIARAGRAIARQN